MKNMDIVTFALGGDVFLANDLRAFKKQIDMYKRHPNIDRGSFYDYMPDELFFRLPNKLMKYLADASFMCDGGFLDNRHWRAEEIYMTMVMSLIND